MEIYCLLFLLLIYNIFLGGKNMIFKDIRESLEYKKSRLDMLKSNMTFLESDSQFRHKFYTLEENIGGVSSCNISQSKYSLPLLFAALKYPDAKTCFFIELFNFYQNLDFNILYRSFSPAMTTYALQELSRKHLIDFKIDTRSYFLDLSDYGKILGNYNLFKNEKERIYLVYFYKLSSIKKEHLSTIISLAKIVGIDFSNIKVYLKNDIMYLGLEKRILLKRLLSLEYFKKLCQQRKIISDIVNEAKSYIFEDFNDYKRNFRL